MHRMYRKHSFIYRYAARTGQRGKTLMAFFRFIPKNRKKHPESGEGGR